MGVAIRKLPADHRIDEIVEAVEALIVRDRTLAFGMNQVANEIAASRALIYVYFQSVPQIIDEVCYRHLDLLTARLEGLGGQGDATERARLLAHTYLDYVIEHGPALHYILRDSDRHGQLEKSRASLLRLIAALVADARTLLQFDRREALVLIELLAAIPDSLARQWRDRRIDLSVARTTCDRLISDLVADLRVAR